MLFSKGWTNACHRDEYIMDKLSNATIANRAELLLALMREVVATPMEVAK